MNDHILGITLQVVTNQPNCTILQSIFHFPVNFYWRNYPVWQPSILKQAFIYNFFLRILQSKLNSQGLISMQPLNEDSQDLPGLKSNRSKITELLIMGLLPSVWCKEKGLSFLKNNLTMCSAFLFNSFLSSRPFLHSSSPLCQLTNLTQRTVVTKPFDPSFHN